MSDAPEFAWGAATQRALSNFPLSGHTMPVGFLRAFGLFKQCAARANRELGRLPEAQATAIETIAAEIAAGQHAAEFPIDIFQTGSGTSTNTNVNEVIVGLARERYSDVALRLEHVNLSQSANDAMPSALQVGVAVALAFELTPALEELEETLGFKADEFSGVAKVGRTHLVDTAPMTLGQAFSGYARQLRKAVERAQRALEVMSELAVGGTAIGTGLHAPPGFAARVCQLLSVQTGLSFREAANHFEAQGARDDCVEVAGLLATIAVSLDHVASDLRLLASGPRGGLGEVRLPLQPGAAAGPGEGNVALCESVIQVAIYVQGLTSSVVACGRAGQLELNPTVPLLAWCLHESITCLSNVARLYARRGVSGLEVDRVRCAELTARSLLPVAPTLEVVPERERARTTTAESAWESEGGGLRAAGMRAAAPPEAAQR